MKRENAFAIVLFRGQDGAHHGVGTGNQNKRVGGREREPNGISFFRPRGGANGTGGVPKAEHKIADQKTAEQHDFRENKNPNPDLSDIRMFRR
jgi:hypothetical protein